jgi:hypothetical protein
MPMYYGVKDLWKTQKLKCGMWLRRHRQGSNNRGTRRSAADLTVQDCSDVHVIY